MSVILDHFHSPWVITYGYHFEALKQNEYENENRTALGLITIGNLLCWIPLVGSLVGACRFVAGALELHKASTKEDKQFAISLMIRGSIEFVGGGPMFIAIDVIYALGRHIANR